MWTRQGGMDDRAEQEKVQQSKQFTQTKLKKGTGPLLCSLLCNMHRNIPHFGWGRAHFLPSRWYNAVFWIQCENNVDNTLMLQLLLK